MTEGNRILLLRGPCFALVGAALARFGPPSRHARRGAAAAAGLVLALEFATAIERLTGADLGLDLGQASE